jgi:hypothetical protein
MGRNKAPTLSDRVPNGSFLRIISLDVCDLWLVTKEVRTTCQWKKQR